MIQWYCKSLDELTLREFYDIAAARIEVFVIEQNCPYQELDDKDKKAFHLYATDSINGLLAYARILPQGVSYNEVSIGRVITTKAGRGKGLGHELMKRAMDIIKTLFGNVDVRISAQQHLQGYYSQHGFVTVSDMYLEDDIPHVEMVCVFGGRG